MDRKLVVLGTPWDVDTNGLKKYMVKFGELEDCIIMKERNSRRSHGFGYVTFSSIEDAKKALSSEHILGNRVLKVKVATPKEEMLRSSSKKITRIFVAKIAPSVTESNFRRIIPQKVIVELDSLLLLVRCVSELRMTMEEYGSSSRFLGENVYG